MSLVEKSVKASMKKLLHNSKKRKLSETNFNIEASEKEKPLTSMSLKNLLSHLTMRAAEAPAEEYNTVA